MISPTTRTESDASSSRGWRLASRHPRIANVRGRGLLVGFDFVGPGTDAPRWPRRVVSSFSSTAWPKGVILMSYTPRVRIHPPLIITEDEARQAIDMLDRAFVRRSSNEQVHGRRGGPRAASALPMIPPWRDRWIRTGGRNGPLAGVCGLGLHSRSSRWSNGARRGGTGGTAGSRHARGRLARRDRRCRDRLRRYLHAAGAPLRSRCSRRSRTGGTCLREAVRARARRNSMPSAGRRLTPAWQWCPCTTGSTRPSSSRDSALVTRRRRSAGCGALDRVARQRDCRPPTRSARTGGAMRRWPAAGS